MESLREYLKNYGEVTQELIDCLSSQNFEDLEALIEKRQRLIEDMKNISYTGDEFKSICSRFQIMALEKKLDMEMKEKLNNTKNELKRILSGRKMKNSYTNTGSNVDALYLSKKI